VATSFRRPTGDRNQTARGAFLAPSALFGAAWAARRKASPPLALIHIFLNSKSKIQNLKFPRLSSARPFASPRPSGLRKALASTTHGVINTPNSKLTTRNSKLWLATPLLGNAGGVGPSALSGFARLRLRRTSSTPRRCGLAFRASGPTAPGRAFLASLRNACPTLPMEKLFWTGVKRVRRPTKAIAAHGGTSFTL
jgi:hypothetical protein